MIAVEEVYPWHGVLHIGDGGKSCDLKPHRGLIAVQPMPARSQKPAVQYLAQGHAGKDTKIGI